MTCLPHSIARTLVPWLQFPWIRVQQRCTFYTWYYFIPPAARVTAGGPPPRPHHRNERGVGAAPGLALCLMVPGHSLQTMCHTAGAGWGTFRISILSTILYGYQVKRVFGSLTAMYVDDRSYIFSAATLFMHLRVCNQAREFCGWTASHHKK